MAPALWAGTCDALVLPGDPPSPVSPASPASPVSAGWGLLALPFDALRLQYASAVMAGLVQRSILASGRLERALDALEKLVLGPLARQR
jgi:hypothetical protein